MSSTTETKSSARHKLLLLGLLSAVFAVNVIDVFVPLLLPEIASAFHITRAVAMSLTAFSALAGVVTGFALSALSVKINYKALLFFGVILTPICVLGVYFAPSFFLAQVFYALNGVGSVVVAAMVPTLISALYPTNQKAKRISWTVATAWMAILVASPLTGYLSTSGAITSWRTSLLWFLLPVTAVCTVMVVLFVPSRTLTSPPGVKKDSLTKAFKEIFSNKSAVACLTNNFLGGTWLAATIFPSSFSADVFNTTPSLRGLIALTGLGALVAGTLIGGFLVNPIGRKRLFVSSAVTAVLLSVLSYAISIYIPNLWLGVGIRSVSGLLGGFVFVAGPSLYVEQVPKHTGAMLLFGSGLGGTGRAIGVFGAGGVLTYFGTTATGYTAAIGTLAAIGLAGAAIILLFAKDPCRNQPQTAL